MKYQELGLGRKSQVYVKGGYIGPVGQLRESLDCSERGRGHGERSLHSIVVKVYSLEEQPVVGC